MKPLYSITYREILRFYRQKGRVLSTLVTPLIFWMLLGLGLNQNFSFQGVQSSYFEFLIPGNLVLVILFASIFSTISLIEDRNSGFMQGVIVAPIPREMIVLGKVLGGSLLALLQGFIYLVLVVVISQKFSVVGFLSQLLILFILSLSLVSLGFYFAWKLNSTQGYHAVMNILLFPMWFLSGALFPYESAPLVMKVLMKLNPLHYGLLSLKSSFAGEGILGLNLLIILIFGLIFFVRSFYLVKNNYEKS
jgi:ABC-2 type transport system permease protein